MKKRSEILRSHAKMIRDAEVVPLVAGSNTSKRAMPTNSRRVVFLGAGFAQHIASYIEELAVRVEGDEAFQERLDGVGKDFTLDEGREQEPNGDIETEGGN